MNVQTVQHPGGEVKPTGLEVLIQLYEGCIRFLGEASAACDEGRVEHFKDRLHRAQRIIEYFQQTLDFEKGGQVPGQLNDLYTFMLDSLVQSGLTHDVGPIDRVVDQLEILLEGWRGVQAPVYS